MFCSFVASNVWLVFSFRCLGRGITITIFAHVCLYSFQWVSTSFLFFFGFSLSLFILPFSTILKLAVSGKCYLFIFGFISTELFCWTCGFTFAVFGVCSFGYFVTYFGGVFTDFVFLKTCRKWVSYLESFSQHVRVCVFAVLL